jgi:serine/threonine protein kinase
MDRRIPQLDGRGTLRAAPVSYHSETMKTPDSPKVVGRYAIFAKIASGGMASVHFGRLLGAAGFSRTVAIKRLHPHLAEDPDFLSTMIDEAHVAARVHHPNVVPTLDVVAEGTELLVVMEYVRGESLSRLFRTEAARLERIPLPIAIAVAVGALHGLHAAHEATSEHGDPLAIVHRDVSPQNILVGIDGVARVIDFGVAKATGRLQTTRPGVLKGKMAYMAPEQLSGGEVSRRVDIYALGVVLWEVLAGKRLFAGESDEQLVVKILVGAKEPPSQHTPGVPAELDAIVMRALSKNPAERFASAREMADALMRVVTPAFPPTVGEWVEALAHDALSRRTAQVAEIESSGVATAAKAADHAHSQQTGEADGSMVASQALSVSLEVGPRHGRAKNLARLGALLLAGAVTSAMVFRGRLEVLAKGLVGQSNLSAPAPPPLPSAPSSTGGSPTSSATPAVPSATETLARSSTTGASPASTQVPAPRPGNPSVRPHPAPNPSGVMRYTRPD